MNGRDYEVAERGGTEIVATPKNIREAVFGKGGPMSSDSQVIHNYIYLDGKLMREFVVNVIKNEGQIGRLQVSPRAIA
jgi:hypothetical protein